LNERNPAGGALGSSGDGLTTKIQLAADQPVPGSRRLSAVALSLCAASKFEGDVIG
jgi:hypothetical protein